MKKLALLLPLLAVLPGCPQAVSAITPGINFALCVWSTYAKEAPGTPIGQVVADEVASCGGDIISIITVLDGLEPKAQHAHVAHEGTVAIPAVKP